MAYRAGIRHGHIRLLRVSLRQLAWRDIVIKACDLPFNWHYRHGPPRKSAWHPYFMIPGDVAVKLITDGV